MLVKNCFNCNKEFKYLKCREKNGAIVKFCSQKCNHDYYRGSINNTRCKKEDKKCLICENEYKVQQKEIKKGRGNYCSRKCSSIATGLKIKEKSLINKVKKNCRVCGNLIILKKSAAERNGGGTYCSRKCKVKIKMLGKTNPNWKGGITNENKKERSSINYKNWRISVFERDKYTCQDCGQVRGKLHAHHKKSFSKNKDLRIDVSNGETLCLNCHSKHHPNLKENTK